MIIMETQNIKMGAEDIERINKLCNLSIVLSLFSLIGYILLIFILVPVILFLYLIVFKGVADLWFPGANIFINFLQIISIGAGLGAVILGFKALQLIKTSMQQHKKTKAIVGIAIGIIGIVYHIYYLIF